MLVGQPPWTNLQGDVAVAQVVRATAQQQWIGGANDGELLDGGTDPNRGLIRVPAQQITVVQHRPTRQPQCTFATVVQTNEEPAAAAILEGQRQG